MDSSWLPARFCRMLLSSSKGLRLGISRFGMTGSGSQMSGTWIYNVYRNTGLGVYRYRNIGFWISGFEL